jgi:hypothetical protein
MAFGTKYRAEFTDELGIDWQVDIQEDPDPGTITSLQCSGEPLTIEWYGEDDIQDQNIMGSKMSLNIECDSDFAYSDLFTSDNLEYKVIVYQDSNVFWNGYILANNYVEPYDGVPYSTTITATDGLGLLSYYEFKDLGYSARQKISVVIYDILSLVGITTFTEYINLYESTMDSDVGDSPLDQGGVDYLLFKEMDCYEALFEILKSFNAGIRQDNGVFEIFRFKELADATMYGRIFTSGTVKSATTKTPEQAINRTGDASTLADIEGGAMMIIPQLKTININHDYGDKKSIYKNYNFPLEEFTLNVVDSDYDCADWTQSSGTKTFFESYRNPGGSKEGIIVWKPDPIPPTHYIYQTRDIIATSDTFVMQFDVCGITFDASESAGRIHAWVINSDGGTNTEYYNGLIWTTTTGGIEYLEYPYIVADTYGPDINTSEVSFSIDSIPYTGTITVRLYAAGSADENVYGVFSSVKHNFTNSEGYTPEGVAYTVTNAVYGKVIDREYILGDGFGFDNDPIQYNGAINVWSGAVITASSLSWHTRGATENIPLINLIGQEFGAQYERPKHCIDIPIQERAAATFLMLNANIHDLLNQYSAVNRVFAISRAIYNIRSREYQLTLCEIL